MKMEKFIWKWIVFLIYISGESIEPLLFILNSNIQFLYIFCVGFGFGGAAEQRKLRLRLAAVLFICCPRRLLAICYSFR